MKHYQLTLIMAAVLSCWHSHAQDFGQVGTTWYYNENAGGAATGQEYVQFVSEKDTLLGGKTAHKITETYYRYTGDTLHREPYYVYQEADTVYRWSWSESSYLKLFIFNANVGDTLLLNRPFDDSTNTFGSTYRLVINTVDVILVDGIPLKRYQTTGLDDQQFWGGQGYFMDRIGGMGWLVPRGPIIPEAGGPIRCYADGDVDTVFSSVACDFRVILTPGVKDINKQTIQVFPNPTANNISLVAQDGTIETAEVYDAQGNLCLRFENVLMQRFEFNMQDLPSGFYFIRVVTAEEIFIEKVLKTMNL